MNNTYLGEVVVANLDKFKKTNKNFTNRRSTRNSTPPPTNKSPPRKRSPSEMIPPRPRTLQGSQRKRVIRKRVSRKRKRSSR